MTERKKEHFQKPPKLRLENWWVKNFPCLAGERGKKLLNQRAESVRRDVLRSIDQDVMNSEIIHNLARDLSDEDAEKLREAFAGIQVVYANEEGYHNSLEYDIGRAVSGRDERLRSLLIEQISSMIICPDESKDTVDTWGKSVLNKMVAVGLRVSRNPENFVDSIRGFCESDQDVEDFCARLVNVSVDSKMAETGALLQLFTRGEDGDLPVLSQGAFDKFIVQMANKIWTEMEESETQPGKEIALGHLEALCLKGPSMSSTELSSPSDPELRLTRTIYRKAVRDMATFYAQWIMKYPFLPTDNPLKELDRFREKYDQWGWTDDIYRRAKVIADQWENPGNN